MKLTREQTNARSLEDNPDVAPPNWTERHTTLPMLIAGALGLLITSTLVFSFDRSWCAAYLDERLPHVTGVCGMIRENPPWLVLTGLTAAPSVLLTWYWRTSHRKRDLHQKERENSLKDLELQQAKLWNDAARSEKDFGALQRAIENLDSQDPQTVRMSLDTIERTATEKFSRTSAVEALCTFLRSTLHRSPATNASESARSRQRAIKLACTFRVEGQKLDLQSACLHQIDLSNLDLRGADLFAADLDNSKMHGTLLAGAKLFGVMATGCEFNEQTQIDESERKHLMAGGARFVNNSKGQDDA